MSSFEFPVFLTPDAKPTLTTLHHYTLALNSIRRALTPPLKHWYHVSLRLNAQGLTTTPIPGESELFEVALDLTAHRVEIATSRGKQWAQPFSGQTLSQFWKQLNDALAAFDIYPKAPQPDAPDAAPVYDASVTEKYWRALSQIYSLQKRFQSELRGETSPVQFWAHHFDLAMLWFSGRPAPGADSADPENGDEQMNFGFSIGDESTPEPYFYATAYPTPDGFIDSPLPPGAYWNTKGWKGAVLPYRLLTVSRDPAALLLSFFRTTHARGASLMK